MHYRGGMRLKLMLFVGFSVFCQLGCTSQLRVPSKEDMLASWANSDNRLISFRGQRIQALPENIFADFENTTVSFNQTYRLTNKIVKHARVFYIFEVCYGFWKMKKKLLSGYLIEWINGFPSRVHYNDMFNYSLSKMRCTAPLTRQSVPLIIQHTGSKLGW